MRRDREQREMTKVQRKQTVTEEKKPMGGNGGKQLNEICVE